MKILCVEDDHLVAKPILDELQAAFPDAEVKWIGTESEFRTHFESVAANPPDIVIMDVMKLWDVPSRNPAPLPDDVRRGGVSRAGIRCAKMLNNDERTKDVPIILYTVLDEAWLRKEIRELRNCYHVPKEGDINPLLEKIRQVIPLTPNQHGL